MHWLLMFVFVLEKLTREFQFFFIGKFFVNLYPVDSEIPQKSQNSAFVRNFFSENCVEHINLYLFYTFQMIDEGLLQKIPKNFQEFNYFLKFNFFLLQSIVGHKKTAYTRI